MNLSALERVKGTVWLYPSPHLLQSGTDQCQEKTSQPVISPSGEKESIYMSVWLTQLYENLPKRPNSFSPHPEYWVMSYMLGAGQEQAGRDRTLRGINGMWILLTASQTPSRSLLMSYWVCLTLRSLGWPTDTPSSLHASPIAASSGQLSVYSPNGGESKLWQRGSEHTQKTHPDPLGRDHKLEL